MSESKKLSCIRCKQKKLKCDKLVPCSRCKVADTACITAERKPRARNKGIVDSLNTRIDVLEKALHRAMEQPAESPESRQELPTPTPTSLSQPPVESSLQRHGDRLRKASADVAHGPDSEGWVGGLKDVWTAMSSSIKNIHGNGLTKPGTPMSNPMDVLDGAIDDLDSFADVHHGGYAAGILSKDETRQAIEVALQLFRGEFFLSLLDRDFIISLVDVIDVPLREIDPAARVVYYCLVFHGHIISQYKSATAARTLYLQCLEAVPDWQAKATGTVMDIIAASCLCWTCIVSSDGRLSWEFHRKACQYSKKSGLNRMDVLSVEGTRQSSIANDQRTAFWQLVLIDLMYRLGYDKPSAISAEASIKDVRRPSLQDPSHEQPSALDTIPSIVWGRMVFVLKEFFRCWDNRELSADAKQTEELQNKLEKLVDQIDELVTDWNLLALMRANGSDTARAFAYADLLIGAYSCIGQMERIRSGEGHVSTTRSLKASRMVLDTIAEYHQLSARSQYPGMYMYSLAFYPFHAFFTLYYHIISGVRAEEFKEDIERLEKLGSLMVQASQTRFEYVPIAKAITSLNQITRHVHRAQPFHESQQMWTKTPENHTVDSIGSVTASSDMSDYLPTQQSLTDPSFDFQSADFVQLLPPFQGTEMNSNEDFQNIINDARFEPLSYMHALEDQFVGKYANYGGWWSGSAPAI